ncbi:hypothetical protein [Aureimonas sp. D3]|uniref:hypothetical protein n=1 Tax=Aureimonas sp. D3 TaxID=1638164 RepID=UPI000A4C5255|nr:hypothetical protein [Aureimonas sp. D3]
MLAFLKAKARAVAFIAACVLLALQIVLPTALDLLFGMLALGAVWLALRLI